jgi:TctA family transporter
LSTFGELIPAAIFALVVATVVGIAVLVFLLTLTHTSVAVLSPLIPIAVLVVAANIWICERHAQCLVAFVRRELAEGGDR